MQRFRKYIYCNNDMLKDFINQIKELSSITKEIEKASQEKEQDVYNWQAYCKQQSGHAHASRTTNVRSGNSGNAGEIVLFDEESESEDAVAATVIAAETV